LSENGALTSLTKNAAQQISAVVWLDGTVVKNSSVGTIATLVKSTLNLQFATDVKLVPASNKTLYGITTTGESKTKTETKTDEEQSDGETTVIPPSGSQSEEQPSDTTIVSPSGGSTPENVNNGEQVNAPEET
jgi:hypothetical protein